MGKRTQKCDWVNREWRWRQINSIYTWYLDLVVKRLHYINCLNLWATNYTTFRNQKLCCGTALLHKNDEIKNSSGLGIASKMACFLFRANWAYVSWTGGVCSLPTLATRLFIVWCCIYYHQCKSKINRINSSSR